MNHSYFFLTALAVLPVSAHAQGLEDILKDMAIFIDNVVIPFLFGMAFLVFIVNAIRFFVLQSSNENGREKARSLMMYSILAFVFLIIFWGLINLLSSSLGLDGCDAPVNDYQQYNAVGPPLPGC